METTPHDANPIEFRGMKSYQHGPHIARMTNPKPSKLGEEDKYLSELTKLMENGHVILCNRCGKSSDGVRPIITCDYCPTAWTPPLAIPPNRNRAWMCPNHVTPADLVVHKVVDGKVQVRRPRRPRNFSLVDVEVKPTDEDEMVFSDEFSEARLRLAPGDLMLDFISAVKRDRQRVEQESIARLTARLVQLGSAWVAEMLERGVPATEQEVAQFQGFLETEARRHGGLIADSEAEAANGLLQLGRVAGPPGSESRPVTSGPESSLPSGSEAPPATSGPESSANPEPGEARASVSRGSRRRSKRPRRADDEEEEEGRGEGVGRRASVVPELAKASYIKRRHFSLRYIRSLATWNWPLHVVRDTVS
ncbi:hypothetical protein N7468_003838 [Penicillium chermesinum]|uniref:Uncharacterized protein n=1 Tax=Penicillium chermesinum TaxID=63820 RepID=A0A9W9P7F7_9EURO|nr:uncharacterized protein N7468_003838 [Penicillium chermesinum]KAJ5239219.1 hypothetical protein N7468_003838 [Penicillium chermesinum]